MKIQYPRLTMCKYLVWVYELVIFDLFCKDMK